MAFNIKPAVGNGLESEIMLFTMPMVQGIKTVLSGRKVGKQAAFATCGNF